ncbi:hypothetical protein [Luteibacter aegosomatissinici]|uniref:hypothetical protein n=1 Tax=Luteibacter aegosomatissinici TaxID=2911539 RepID=UPI001FF9013B|nr:hypothetical protein [Luteibacter aegosomatissinici]UPG95746.1 hypothetical protein L2Y97_06465 [Luteibacter aegosomatissinici]
MHARPWHHAGKHDVLRETESLALARDQNHHFRGFESDVHGLLVEYDHDGSQHYVVEVLKQDT